MSSKDDAEINAFLRCLSIGKELTKHKKRYNQMVEIGARECDIEQQGLIVSRLIDLSDEVCDAKN